MELGIEQVLAVLSDVERDVAALVEAVRKGAPNTHQRFRDLDLAQGSFEEAFWRLRRAVDPPVTPWKVRHS